MNKKLYIFLFFSVYLCQVTQATGVDTAFELKEKNYYDNESIRSGMLNGTLFKTVKQYYCRVDTGQDQEFLLYGTKGWTFPAQDVKLNLVYPTKSKKPERPKRTYVDYILTEFEVIFHLEGVSSKGYITGGGILQNHINLTFEFTNITSLSFQFYLYGVPRSLSSLKEPALYDPNQFVDLC